MTKNLLGKSRKKDNPYAVFEGEGPHGQTEMLLLKTYQIPTKERQNVYARWFVAVKTPMTYDSYDMGDSYIHDATDGLTLTYASPEFKEQYG